MKILTLNMISTLTQGHRQNKSSLSDHDQDDNE